MDIASCFIVLSNNGKPIKYDTPIPSFVLLALVMDMERAGLITFDNMGKLTAKSSALAPQSYCLLSGIINGSDIDSIHGLIDYMLRHLTYKDLRAILDSRLSEIREKHKFISVFKDKLNIDDSFMHEIYIKFINSLTNDNVNCDGISLAALLYGCRFLKKYLDKTEYKSTVALIKNGISIEGLPITTSIINNIDLIRGHIMGIVAN